MGVSLTLLRPHLGQLLASSRRARAGQGYLTTLGIDFLDEQRDQEQGGTKLTPDTPRTGRLHVGDRWANPRSGSGARAECPRGGGSGWLLSAGLPAEEKELWKNPGLCRKYSLF